MKRYEVLAAVLIAMAILAYLPSPFYSLIIAWVYSPAQVGQFSILQSFMHGAFNILKLVVQIAVAVWLFREASRDDAAKWVWALFGLLFGLIALALYYLWRMYELLVAAPRCLNCGYDLRGSESSHCPECGTPRLLRPSASGRTLPPTGGAG